MKRKINLVLHSLVFAALATQYVSAYTITTHKIINAVAIRSSNLDAYLKNNLQIPDGIRQTFPGGSVSDIISNAGASEDLEGRFFNHFHNPLKPWNQAGLDDTFIFFPVRGKSSLLWGQEAVGVQGWSWRDARTYYYKALTVATQDKREQNLAKTFRAVGQVMHLIVDSSVPAHVRNDAHATGYHYETWASQNVNSLRMTPIFPQLDLFDSGINTGPISDFIDGDRYRGDNPGVTEWSNAGLAEYTNANFFSDDTIFADDFSPGDRHYFPYPNKASVDFRPWTDETNNRQYLKEFKRGGMQHVVEVSWLYWYRQAYFPLANKHFPVGLDEKVYQDQAARLVPRAIGYSAKLLDYFFRGRLDAKGDGEDGIRITNLSGETMSGTFELYYDAIEPVTGEEIRKSAGGPWSLTLAPGAQSLPKVFTEPSDAKAPGKYGLVFKGNLGAEREAVVGSFVELKTIPFAFVIQEEVVAPAPVEFNEAFPAPFQKEISNMVWVSKLDSLEPAVPHLQTTHGRFLFFEQPESIRISGKVHSLFYVNGQVVPDGVWHEGDTSNPPKTWRYEETEGIVCTNKWFSCGDAAVIEIIFKGGQRIEQNLWLYQWVRKSSSVHRALGGYLMVRRVEMYASVGNRSPHRYYGLEPGLQFPGPTFTIPLSQFEILKWPGSEGVDICPPLDIDCRFSNEEWFTWGHDKFTQRGNITVSYRRFNRKVLPAVPRGILLPRPPPLPHLDLIVSGEVKRIYSTRELDLLNKLGVTPIEYTVTFR